jgi:hypothetical protein
MEYENKYASNGKGNLGVTLGAVGLGAALLNGGGILGNVLGGGNVCSDNMPVSRYELGLQQEIAAKDSRIGLLESNIYTDGKIADVYERLNVKIGHIENQLCEQRVYNATNTAAISCIQGQVAQLASLTKTIIPIDNVCPAPMPQYNSWTAPTAPAGA